MTWKIYDNNNNNINLQMFRIQSRTLDNSQTNGLCKSENKKTNSNSNLNNYSLNVQSTQSTQTIQSATTNRVDKSTAKYINICLVGCVSAGKSTVLNAFFSNDYAQCKIKRTTMMPNKFIEVFSGESTDSFETISSTISETNRQIYGITTKGENFNLSDYGNELTFYVEPMEMNIDSQIKICIYDIPGMNDARTKSVYYDYLEKNFHKFNIILFVIDIQSGLNTSDEMDILEFLSRHIAKHKKESNKNIGLLGVINKADSMQLDGDKLEVLGELGEMFDQSAKTIEQKFSQYSIQSNLLGCIPICGLDSNLYRMIKKYKDITKLSNENILRIGINEEGSKFRKLNSNEQKRKVQEIIQKENFVDDMINLSGFSQIEHALKLYINTNGMSMVMENLLWEYNRLPIMVESNLFSNIKERIRILENILPHSLEKYSDYMGKIIKQLNTIIYKKISVISNPIQVKEYYDLNILEPLNFDNNIKFHFSKYFDFTIYPNYLTDRILELVVFEYQNQSVKLTQLEYIELFESVGKLDVNVSNILIQSIIENPRGTNTFNFGSKNSSLSVCSGLDDPNKIIDLIDKLKISINFISFLRFLLANIYTNLSSPENLIEKLFLFDKCGELPMRQFINDLRIEKKLIDTNKYLPFYIKNKSPLAKSSNSASANLIELYYIEKCKEFDESENFIFDG